jgi:EAL and modified HD-GYP domain-containing signal transduction protein
MTGAESLSSIDEAFSRGAAASIGWPLDEPIHPNGAKGLQASQAAVIRMLALVNQYAEVNEIEQAMKVDPAIAFKLMKFINSPVFGATKQITSFSHAIMLLGYKKMLRWLALLMSSSSKDVNNLPVMHASVRRGLFMEQLAQGNSEQKDALFITGAFSLLDKITMQPLDEIFKSISVSKDIQDAVLTRTGPLADPLLLIEAIEKGIPSKIFELQNKMSISALECNSAL